MKGSKFFDAMKKVPLGIISGGCAIAVFYLTVGFIAAYLILSGIAGQTGDTISMFQNWWQTLIFVADIVLAVMGITALVLFVLKRLKASTESKAEVVSERTEVTEG